MSSRIDERHIGVRFHDNEIEELHWHVWFNGIQVEGAIDELYAGENGWIHGWDLSLEEPYLVTLMGEVRAQTCFDVECELKGNSIHSLHKVSTMQV